MSRFTSVSAYGTVVSGIAALAVAVCYPAAAQTRAKKVRPASAASGAPQEMVTRVYQVSDLADLNATARDHRLGPPAAAKAGAGPAGANAPPKAAKGQPPAAKEPEPQPPSHPLVELIQGGIRPKTWDSLGGPGSIEFSGTGKTASLVVKNTRQAQHQIESLLGQLRRMRAAGKAQARPAPLATERPEWEKRIRKALAQKVTVRLQDRPFDEIVRALGKRLGIPILYDAAAFEEVGFEARKPVDLDVAEEMGLTALDLLLRPEGLTWTFQNEALWITTPDEEAEHHLVRVYDVRGLVRVPAPSGRLVDDFDSLINLIVSNIDLSAWDCVGGPGSIEPAEAEGLAALVCSHTREMQELVESFLAGLRAFRGTRSLPTAKLPLTVSLGGDPESLAKVMSRKISLDAHQEPFDHLIRRLAKVLGVEVQCDRKALEEVGFEVNKPFTIHVSGISAAAALAVLLAPEGLTWEPWGGVLVITTPDEAANHPFVRVYDVHDLVYPDEKRGPGYPDFDSLIDLITCCIQPTGWDGCELGDISPFQGEGMDLLVFEQTWEVHREAKALLDALRAVRHASPLKPGEAPVAPFLVPWEKAMRQALGRHIVFSFRRTPLADVAATLKRVLKIEVQLDAKALEESEVPKDAPVTFEQTGITVERALDAILDPLKLTWTIRGEVLWITTPDEDANRLTSRVYDVTGLVPGGKAIDFEWLMDRIAKQVARESWDRHGGPGCILRFDGQSEAQGPARRGV